MPDTIGDLVPTDVRAQYPDAVLDPQYSAFLKEPVPPDWGPNERASFSKELLGSLPNMLSPDAKSRLAQMYPGYSTSDAAAKLSRYASGNTLQQLGGQLVQGAARAAPTFKMGTTVPGAIAPPSAGGERGAGADASYVMPAAANPVRVAPQPPRWAADVPAPTTLPEQVASGVGSAAMYGAEAVPVIVASAGMGAPAVLSGALAGGTGPLLSTGTPEERLAAGGSGMAAGALSEMANTSIEAMAQRLAASRAAYAPAMGQAAQAVTWGAVQPQAENLLLSAQRQPTQQPTASDVVRNVLVAGLIGSAAHAASGHAETQTEQPGKEAPVAGVRESAVAPKTEQEKGPGSVQTETKVAPPPLSGTQASAPSPVSAMRANLEGSVGESASRAPEDAARSSTLKGVAAKSAALGDERFKGPHAEMAAPEPTSAARTEKPTVGERASEGAEKPRGIPPAPTLHAPSEAASKSLPTAEVPGGKLMGEKAAASPALEKARAAFHEVTAVVNPVKLAPPKAVDVLMKHKGELEQQTFRTEQNQKSLKAYWEQRSPGEKMDFLNRLERGEAPTPELAEIDKGYRDRADNIYKAVSQYKDVPYWENWFPHLFTKPEQVKAFLNTKSPIEGSKRFLKHRLFPDIQTALKAGFKLAADNPEVLMQAAEHDARKFVMMQEMLKDMKAAGHIKYGNIGERPGKGLPDDFAQFDGRWAKVYLNPEKSVPVKEYHDERVMGALKETAANLKIPLERKLNLGRGMAGVLGYAETKPGGKVVTKFATPEDVLMHEIGHQIDKKYGMQAIFKGPEVTKELRKLADLRFEGKEDKASTYFKKYVRSGPEKMAVMFQAYLHMPDRFKEVAPETFKAFQSFLGAHDELKPLAEMKPSLLFGSNTDEIKFHAGGLVLGGEYWGQKDLARLLNNYMSRDFITGTTLGRSVMASRNTLNGIDLGLSGFHATGMTLLSVMNRMSVGLSEISQGDVLKGMATVGKSPMAPLDYIREGQKLYKNDPSLAQVENDAFAGGMSLRDRAYYKNQAFDSFIKNVRMAKAGDRTAAAKAVGLAPVAAIEAPMRLLTTHVIPQMKIGAFRELFAQQLEQYHDEIVTGKITREQLARQTWNNVENRMGLLNYDNLFWNQTLKSAVMVLTRAPGWTLGTLREFGGAEFIDMPRFIKSGMTGKKPDFTARMSFALSMAFTTLAVNGIYGYLHGHRPKDFEDWLHPWSGAYDARGQKVRMDMPTYWKDVANWHTNPVKAAVGDPIGHGGKLAPEVTLFMDLLQNQSTRGPIHRPVRSMRDWYPAAEDVTKYLFGRLTPFSVQNANTLAKGHATLEEKIESFFGITRHQKPSAQHAH